LIEQSIFEKVCLCADRAVRVQISRSSNDHPTAGEGTGSWKAVIMGIEALRA
jgi:hypothetical protein